MFIKIEYTIKAEISVVSKETNSSDNIFVYGKVAVPYEGGGEGDAMILYYAGIILVVVLVVSTLIFFRRGHILKKFNQS